MQLAGGEAERRAGPGGRPQHLPGQRGHEGPHQDRDAGDEQQHRHRGQREGRGGRMHPPGGKPGSHEDEERPDGERPPAADAGRLLEGGPGAEVGGGIRPAAPIEASTPPTPASTSTGQDSTRWLTFTGSSVSSPAPRMASRTRASPSPASSPAADPAAPRSAPSETSSQKVWRRLAPTARRIAASPARSTEAIDMVL